MILGWETAHMASATYAIFRQAILELNQITCTYQGRYREICPHVLGYKSGKEQALAFQFGGDSSKGLAEGGEWRCLVLDQVQDAKMREGPWHTNDSHLKPQTCVDQVDVEVKV
jgi:predicted DNA-binding transcriptional regulator YafY